MASRQTDILIVEDNESDLELALYALREYNRKYLIRVARDGQEALDLLSVIDEHTLPDEYPKVVLLDLNLPKVSGLAVLRQLKENRWTREIPIVIMTASQDESDLAECYRLGVNSYVVKPLDIDQFTRVVRRIGLYWLLLNQPKD